MAHRHHLHTHQLMTGYVFGCQVLLGHSSDPCPAPNTVTVAVFDAICSQLSRTGRDVTLVTQCYQCDHNVTPCVYRLLEKQDIEGGNRPCL